MPAAQASQTRTTASEFVLIADPALRVDSVTLESGRWTIGSSDKNRIVVVAPGIAAQHCLIVVRGEQLLLKSWSRRTRINGVPVSEAFLQAGDILNLGESCFQIRRSSAATAAGLSDSSRDSLAGRLESLVGVVEELDEELSGRQPDVDRLDETIARIQACVQTGETPEHVASLLHSGILDEEDAIATTGSEAETADADATGTTTDLRVQATQRNLDHILDGFEESVPATGALRLEQPSSMRAERQLQRQGSFASSPQSSAVVLEQQARVETGIDRASRLSEVIAGKRSRDEAIRQLDELIRVAVDESPSDVPLPPGHSSTGRAGRSPEFRFDATSGTDTVTEDESAWNTRAGSVEIDFRDESPAEDHENPSETESTEDSIEATIDFASKQLADFSKTACHLDFGDSATIPDTAETADEFETGSTELPVDSSLRSEDFFETVPEFAPGFDGSAGSLFETAEPPSASLETETRSDESRNGERDELESWSDVAHIEDTWREDDLSQKSAFPSAGSTSEDGADTGSGDENSATPEPVKENSPTTPEQRVQELRAQLAQLFEMSGTPPESPVTDENPSPDNASAESPCWDSTVPDSEPAGPFAELQEESHGETESSSTVETAELITSENADSAENSVGMDGNDPDSISAYMEQLLARNRRQTDTEPSGYEPAPARVSQPELMTPKAAGHSAAETGFSNVTGDEDSNDAELANRSWLTEGPKHRQDRDAVRASLATLREVANESARSAVVLAGRSQLRREILSLTAACLICLVFAVSAVLLKVNPLLPLGAVGLSLFFAVKLGLEMHRSAKILRQVKSPSSSASSGMDSAITPDEVIVQAADETE